MKNDLCPSQTEMVPNLERITARNAWKFALYCDHQIFDGTCAAQSRRLNRFYNFSNDLSRALHGANFIHEFCHIVFTLALDEMQNNRMYREIDIPFDYPSNGNFIAEMFADAIQLRLLKRPENDKQDWEIFKNKIDDYAVAVEYDHDRTKAAIESAVFQSNPMTIFEASRITEFEEGDVLGPNEILPAITKWGEHIRPDISSDDLDVMARQIYAITTPVVLAVREWLDDNDGEYLTREELRETIDEALKDVQMNDLRRLIRCADDTPALKLIPLTL